jgi:hypothetical protein
MLVGEVRISASSKIQPRRSNTTLNRLASGSRAISIVSRASRLIRRCRELRFGGMKLMQHIMSGLGLGT